MNECSLEAASRLAGLLLPWTLGQPSGKAAPCAPVRPFSFGLPPRRGSARDDLDVAAGLAAEIDHARAVLLMRIRMQVDVDEDGEIASAMRASLRGGRRSGVHEGKPIRRVYAPGNVMSGVWRTGPITSACVPSRSAALRRSHREILTSDLPLSSALMAASASCVSAKPI